LKSHIDLGSTEWKTVIREGAGQLGIGVSDGQAALFAAHAREMVHWNKRINLTSVTDPLEMAVKHYLDSIAAVALLQPGASLLDVGSGAGFPGIPLKIMRPSLQVTLLEARRKRVSFLKHAVRSLELGAVNVLHERVERMRDLLAPDSGFDVIVSRAFSELRQFARHGLPLLNPGGCLVAYKGKKGAKLDAEVAGLAGLTTPEGNGIIGPAKTRLCVDVQTVVLPGLEMERALVIISNPDSL
jgi:16S rRNA (guanine527-N7)-methyltransferase